MLFHSPEFLFVFLPAVLAAYWGLARIHSNAALVWLVAGSLFFYAWWKVEFLPVLVLSVVFNYALGRVLSRPGVTGRKWVLTVGVAANLATLAYFKYVNFFIANLEWLFGKDLPALDVVLPLGISFFTFQQIAFLVDASRGETREHGFLKYCLFVSFFPQLIAGPIVHHKEMLPQFSAGGTHRVSAANLAIGATIFVVGFVKKVIIADSLAVYATPVFATAAMGTNVTLLEAWTGALAYTLQLYFDFSAYSEMAIGAARMFGILLPLNFNSPYKARNIIDFWRRWHITLSRFLRDYLYIPLGGNRKGAARRYVNLFVTMLLGGIWHGAGWTFVLWGALHGFYLIVNHLWRSLWGPENRGSLWGRLASTALTFVCVVFAWVFFRAPDYATAIVMTKGMLGFNGVVLPYSLKATLTPAVFVFENLGIGFGWTNIGEAVPRLGMALAMVWLLPNTHQLLAKYEPYFKARFDAGLATSRFAWRPAGAWGVVLGMVFGVAVSFMLATAESEFLYFDF